MQNTTIWTGRWGRIGGRRLESRGRAREVGALLEAIELSGDEVVLDIGAGPGLVTLALAERLPHGHVIALDLSPEMQARLLANAEKRGLADRVQAVEADAVATGLDGGAVDLAVSNMLLHELLDLDALLHELSRVVRPGGWIVLRDFRRSLLSRAMVRVFHGTSVVGPLGRARLEEALRRAGFEEVSVTRDEWAQIARSRRPRQPGARKRSESSNAQE
jgi:ubiquinone/menaquinone biosynthesis C-methylase UbiE